MTDIEQKFAKEQSGLYWSIGNLFNLHVLKIDKDEGKKIHPQNEVQCQLALDILKFRNHTVGYNIMKKQYDLIWGPREK